MKYFGSKMLIVLCTAAATIGVWAVLAWPAWHASPPSSVVSSVVEPIATTAPPPTPAPAPITPQPTAAAEPPAVVRRVVYVPLSAADSTSTGTDLGAAATPPDSVPGVPDPASAQPPQQPDPAGSQQPVATLQPPAPVQTAPPTPAPTPIESGAS